MFGRSFNDIGTAIRNKIISFNEEFEQTGKIIDSWKNTDSIWSRLYPSNKNIKEQLIDVDKLIPEIDESKASKILEFVRSIEDGTNEETRSFQELYDTGNKTNQWIAEYAQSTKDQIRSTEGVIKANQQARASALAHNEAIKVQTFSAKAGKVALQALAMAGNMIAMWGITEVVSAIYSCATASDRLKESASDLGSQFSSTKSDIEGYKTKINDLYNVINDSSFSYEDTYNARQQLLTIQDEMIEKFGSEAEAVQLVTTAINGQTEALDSLTKQKWQETVNEFTNGSDKKWTERVGDSWANLWSGASNNFDRMIKEMENAEVSFRVIPRYDDEGTYEEFSKKLKENFGASITHTERDDVFTLSGDLDEIYDQLLNIQSLAMNMGIDDSFLPDLSRQADAAKKTLESYQEIYNQHILYDKIFDNETYEKSFNNINDAYKKYQEAFASGNDDAIETAKQSFAEIVQGATEGISDQSVIDYFNSMYPDLQTVVSGWEFELRFKAAIEDDKDNFENDVKDYVSKFKTSDDIRNYNEKTATDEQITAYYALLALADEYETDLDNLIAKLEQLGLIAPQVDADIRNSIRSISDDHGISDRNEYNQLIAYTADFTEEEKKLWLESTKGTKNATEAIKMYEAALTKAQQTADKSGNSQISISDTIDQLNTKLKPAMDSIKDAYKNMFDDDRQFDLQSVDIFSTCDSIKSKLDEMSDPEGLNLDVDYSAFEDFVRVLNNTESTEDDVEKAFDSLSTSITQAALSGAEDFETMKAALEDLGVVNNEMVAFQALASNTEMLEQALDEANVSMDDFIVNTEDGSVEATNAGRAFLEEKVGAENCAEALNILAFQKQLCNLQEMNTANEVANLKTLAENAGYTGEVIQYLTELEKIYQEIASGTLTKEQILVKTGKAAVLKALIDNAASNINYEPKVDFSGATKAAGKAGKDAGKSYKDGLKEQLSDLDGVISGITSRIDDQISVINEQKSAALESIDAQKEALEEAKEAAIEALEAERDTQLAIVEEQKKTLEKQIKAKQDEIDAINDAADARQREIDLQKAQYELERMQNQRTKLVYSEDKGMHYVQDTQGIRDAKESVDDAKRQIEIANLEKEKELLEDQAELLDERIDAITEYYDALIEQTEKAYDQQINDLEKQRKETESYFESIINGFESSKSKYQELTEILDKAELSAKLKQLGIDEEALLNGSEEEFNKLKDAYMNIVLQLNQGNDEVLTKLRELSGYEGTAPAMLEDSNTKLDTMNAELGTASKEVGNINSFLGKTVLTTGETATNVGNVLSNLCELSSNLSTVNSLVAEEQTAFDNLKAKIDEVIKAINLKTQAIQEKQNAVSIATNSEIADFLLLKEKILEIKETLESFGTQDEGLISNIVRAIQSLNEISLENGIIGQFSNLKEAIDSVTSAISGNGASSGSERQGGDNGKGGGTRGKDSNGKSSGGGSLADAITSMGETAKEVIGESDAEGDGTVIGEFGSLKTAVDNVTSAIGSSESENDKSNGGNNGKGGSKSRSKDENNGNLIGSIVNLGQTTEETLGEPGGDGIIGRFEQFKEPISEAAGHVQSISNGLDDIDGKEVECTITVNVNQTGGADIGGATLGKMNLDSTSHSAKFGKSNANGTDKNKGLPKAERNALISEYGQTELTVFPNGNTVFTNKPTIMDLPKGTIVFNEDQTKQLMRDKIHVGDTAHTNSTTSNIQPAASGEIKIMPLHPSDQIYDYMQKWNAYFGSTDNQTAALMPGSMFERGQQLYNAVNQITTNNISGKNQPNIHVDDIHITCPGVTSKEVAKQVGVELNHMFSGLHLDADQQSRLR